jgi:predicted RNA binding protein YcfA (HicA-like mRNA interferase family)
MERGEPPARTVIPNHDSIRVGTLRDIINDAGLTIDEFVKLL